MTEQDNLEVAMNNEADHMELTVQTDTGSEPGSPATAQVLIRTTAYDRERWKQAAELHGMTMSEFIRTAVDGITRETLDCTHPINQRRYYPWAEFCLKCGQRLRG
jgi:hypothetical protein